MAGINLRRRQLLQKMALLGSGLPLLPKGIYSVNAATVAKESATGDSLFGYWTEQHGLPAFVYNADQEALPQALWDPLDRPPSRRHFHVLGNRAVQMQVSNTGDIALFDESEGMRWLIYGDDKSGTGHSVVTEVDGRSWGSSYALRPPGKVPQRTIGPSMFTVAASDNGLDLERTLLCPEGDKPWLLVRVRLGLAAGQASRRFHHTERWTLQPRFLNTFESQAQRDAVARSVSYNIKREKHRLVADERFTSLKGTIGAPASIMLESLNPVTVGELLEVSATAEADYPVLEIHTALELRAGETKTLWFRLGREDPIPVVEPEATFSGNLLSLQNRLPVATTTRPSAAHREVPWHYAMLSGGANRDSILGGHTLNQSSVYGFGLGANAAARDAIQHALPLVYSEPELALSVLRNTCAWGSPDGDLPYALDGAKQPITSLFRPSDQNLWVLWLASEYAAVTGDLDAFRLPQSFHPMHSAPPVDLTEHLVRQFNFFVEKVGRGARNHVSLLNTDWNDMVLEDTGLERDKMIADGSSVLNSAMASWVLSVFSPLMEKLGRHDVALKAKQISIELRELVAESWNGKWYDRAYGPDGIVVGRERCWLEVQPWAILCGAADGDRAKKLLTVIKSGHCADSPLGARVIWPPDKSQARVGQGTTGGIWYSINMTLIWAAAQLDPDFAWEQWQAMTLDNHTSLFPHLWEGTLSGPDAWNAPESKRPGQTWTTPQFSMQAYPVNNLHSHSQPLLAYIRLLGVSPRADGTLGAPCAGAQVMGSFKSRVVEWGRE